MKELYCYLAVDKDGFERLAAVKSPSGETTDMLGTREMVASFRPQIKKIAESGQKIILVVFKDRIEIPWDWDVSAN